MKTWVSWKASRFAVSFPEPGEDFIHIGLLRDMNETFTSISRNIQTDEVIHRPRGYFEFF
jgi:hypothetical protein